VKKTDDLGLIDLFEALLTKVAIGEQVGHIYQGQTVGYQDDQGRSHDVREVWGFLQALWPGPSKGF
jgi:hypothetical protein